MKPPLLFAKACAVLGLRPDGCQAWWRALRQARYVDSVSFKQDILFVHCRGWSEDVVDGWFSSGFTPARCLAVLETLVHEQLLTRPQATVIEEHVLSCTDAQGHWRRADTGSPSGTGTPHTSHATG